MHKSVSYAIRSTSADYTLIHAQPHNRPNSVLVCAWTFGLAQAETFPQLGAHRASLLLLLSQPIRHGAASLRSPDCESDVWALELVR